MNPYFQQQQLSAPQLQSQQYVQQNFPTIGPGQQPYRIPNPYQATASWTPQPYVTPGYQFPFPMGGQIPMPVPFQQQSTSQRIVKTTANEAPPLPNSNPPPEPAPLPPPPDTVPFKPAPPPPDEGTNNGSRSTIPVNVNKDKSTDQPNLKPNDEEKPGFQYKAALSSLAVSQQPVGSNEDLETLRGQQRELENQMKKYQSEYEKWFKEFTLWKKQHESHPDQRKYIEYQQKYQKLIEQQQQALKQQYFELQNRIRKKKETGLSTGDAKPYPIPNADLGQRESFPHKSPISQGISRANVMVSSKAIRSTSDREYETTVSSQSAYATHQLQTSPNQQPKETFDFQNRLDSDSRPYQQQQGVPSWQKLDNQELSQRSAVPSRKLDNNRGGQYEKHISQQSGMIQYDGAPSSIGNQTATFHHNQPQLSSTSVYHDMPQRGIHHLHGANHQQALSNQTSSRQPQNLPYAKAHLQTQDLTRKINQDHPDVLSHRAPVHAQTYLQSQDHTENKNQELLHTLPHRAPVDTHVHLQSQGFNEVKSQGHPHTSSHRAPISSHTHLQAQDFAEKKNQDFSNNMFHRAPVNAQAHMQSQCVAEVKNQDHVHAFPHRAPMNAQAQLQNQDFAEKKNQDFSSTMSHRAPLSSHAQMQNQSIPDMKNHVYSHTLSQRAPVNTQSRFQSQGFDENKNQDHPQAFSMYQGSHSQYLNQNKEKGIGSHQFQAPSQQVVLPSQLPSHNSIKSNTVHQGPFNQQQSVLNQSRKQGSISRSDAPRLAANVPKNMQNINQQRVQNIGKLLPEQNMKSKPIPSLMSQQIPKKDYFDAKLAVEEEEEEGTAMDPSVETQGIPTKSINLVTKHGIPFNTRKEVKGEMLASTSWDAEDFTSDDMTGISDWENEETKPLSPRSKLQQRHSYGQANVSQIANPPRSTTHPNSIVPTRPVQHGAQQQHQDMQAAPQIATQLRPRFNQSSQVRPLVSKPIAHSMTPRLVLQQQDGSPNKKSQARPMSSSAPPVESPALMQKEVVRNRHDASAPSSQNVPMQFSQRATGAGQGLPKPPLNSSGGAHMQGMKQASKDVDSVVAIVSDEKRLPSLTHQYPIPSNVFNYKKADCRHYPNCRFKASCHNRHPPCPDNIYCDSKACAYDHPQLSRKEINDIKAILRSQKTEPAPSKAPKSAGIDAQQGKPSSEPHSNLLDSGESLQEGEGLGSYRSGQGNKQSLLNRDRYHLPREDFGYHDGRESSLPRNMQEEMYRGDQNYEDAYMNFDRSREIIPNFPTEVSQFGVTSKSSGSDGRYNDITEVEINDKSKNLDGQGKKETFTQEGMIDLKDKEKKGVPEGMRSTNRNVANQEASDNVDDLGHKLFIERQAEAAPTLNPYRLEGKRYMDGLPRGSSINDNRILEPDRSEYMERCQGREQHPDDQYYSRESEWRHMRDHSRRYGDQVYQDNGMFGGGEDFDRRGAYHRTPARDEWRRQHMGSEVGRPFARSDIGRCPPEGDPSKFNERDYHSGDYPARGPFRDETTQFGEHNQPASPPRRESFREQLEFEKRYRDWERQHFPIDDPTREWEYELRRRELLGAAQATADTAASVGYGSTDPPRDYQPPYEVESFTRSYDDRHRCDPSYSRDHYLDRPRDILRPAVFDYDHSTKFGLYDVDPWKLTAADDTPLDSTAVAASNNNPVYQSQGHKPSSPLSSSLGTRRGSFERSSADRRRLSPSRHSRSPQSSRSPRRGNSPRRDDLNRSSRSLLRKSRSPSRRSGSPSRHLPTRRSSSPRKRRPSPLHDRHRSREDSRSRDRSDRKDHLSDFDRRRSQQDLSYLERDRIPYDRHSSREQAGDPYYGRYGETRVAEITPAEPGPEILPIQDLLDSPGRSSRPKQIVIILRGPPGCGKTHIAKIIKDKEVTNNAPAPRILALDDYFIQETDVYEKDPDTGKKAKVKKMEYVYENDMEDAYRVSLLKSFNKTLDNGYFPLVIIDAINDKVEHFQKFWSDGKHKGFEVYIAEMHGEAQDCAEKNIHNWTQDKIQKMLDNWESTPNHFKQLDVRSLVQDAAIKEVEMEEVEQPVVEKQPEKERPKEDDEDIDEEDLGTFHIPQKSKWEESKDEQLAKLDGISHNKNKRKATDDMFRNKDDDDYYDDDPYDEREEDMRIGKKRVRWADIEEKKELEHRKRIGFCIGTDWSVLTDPNAQVPL